MVSFGGPAYALAFSPKPYPSRLQQMLGERFTGQTITVFNGGRSGEWAADALPRLQGLLRSQTPEVLLLMEGDNDLDALGERGIQTTARAVEALAAEGRNRGVRVFIATLPPQRSGGSRAQSAALIPRFNAELREIARGEGAVLVDVYAAFGSDALLIGSDGLHPTEAGYDRIAQTFYNAIVNAYEVR
jgi:lysophospholipase L1-like esterase